MAGFFQVDLDVLSKMTSTLQQAGDEMDQALQAFGAAEDGQIEIGRASCRERVCT